MISSACYHSPIGDLWLYANNDGLVALSFHEKDITVSSVPSEPSLLILKETMKQLDEYFSGERPVFSIPLVLNGTLFQRSAWKVLQQIPYGSTITYAEEAAAMNRPKSFRAAANANHANPIAIIIPCHRVCASGGKLGGYGGGIDKKLWLLRHEGVSGAEKEK